MKKVLLVAVSALLFAVSCKKDAEELTYNLDNTTWSVTTTPLVGSPATVNVLFKDNDSVYVSSLGLGKWSVSGTDVVFNVAALNYTGTINSATNMTGDIKVGTTAAGTFSATK